MFIIIILVYWSECNLPATVGTTSRAIAPPIPLDRFGIQKTKRPTQEFLGLLLLLGLEVRERVRLLNHWRWWKWHMRIVRGCRRVVGLVQPCRHRGDAQRRGRVRVACSGRYQIGLLRSGERGWRWGRRGKQRLSLRGARRNRARQDGVVVVCCAGFKSSCWPLITNLSF